MPTEQEYIARIKELENELIRTKKQKRYGLVWEDKKEDVVERCKHELPVLVADESKTLSDDPSGPAHILIEGDNFHALSVLEYTHAGKVDIIYIDPPYNTGNKDFIYNDSFVDKEDTFRHSKWLSFMQKRLEIAKRLLRETGVIFISIDDNEQANLNLLCNSIFGDGNFVTQFCWRKTDNQANIGQIANVKEYILCFSKNKSLLKLGKISLSQKAIKEYRYEDTKGKFRRANLLDKSRGRHFYDVLTPSGNIINGPWMIREDDFRQIESQELIFWASGKIEMPYGKTYLESSSGQIPSDNLGTEVGTNQQATVLLEKILGGKLFDFPKPHTLIYFLLQISSQKNAVILDFFAGSGTTGHAVLELNKEDGGNRQFILCTNNENQIAEEVTYPRIHNVIKGYADVEGIPANLRYYRTDFISNDKSIDDLRHKFILRCSEMLQVRENCFERVSFAGVTNHFQVFEGLDSILVILYDPYDDIDKLAQLARTVSKRLVVYVFSMSTEIWEEEISHIAPNITIETIPDEILETYKKIFGF